MKKIIFLLAGMALLSCTRKEHTGENSKTDTAAFDYIADRFADIQVLRYEVKGFDELSLQQKQLAYYLYQAGLSGRDIFYDQKYRYGLQLRKTLEAVLNSYKGDRSGEQWDQFMVYCKRFFFSNGNHHHYSSDKIIPGCSQEYFASLINSTDPSQLPLNGMTAKDFLPFVSKIVFDSGVDPKGVDLNAKDVITASCNNFYSGVNQKEVEKYYNDLKESDSTNRSQVGFNSQLVKVNGKMTEKVWKSGGMYGPAIDKIIYWLQKAEVVAENDAQKNTIHQLIEFYKTGDPKQFDNYSIAWVADTVKD